MLLRSRNALKEKIASQVSTTRLVQQREFQLRADVPTDPLPLVGLNIGFTNQGIQKLVPGADLGDSSFATGAKAQAADPNSIPDPTGGPPNLPINDPVDDQGNLTTWRPEFLADDMDGVLLITGGTQPAVDSEAADLLALLAGVAKVQFDQTGNVRPGAQKGHEHFGWLDGVSQPAVAGLSSPFPGQIVLDPGAFVFGYPDGPAPALPWMKNGSFMAFRRLNQLVPEFTQFVQSTASNLGMDPALLGARLVGRWKSGAPVALAPVQDDAGLGQDPTKNDNFDFANDQDQRRCPFSAHIRKTNPRADFADLPPVALNSRRIMRAGIPFGPELDSVAESSQTAPGVERGLMFVCYQTSLLHQFEFVQGSWANNPDFVSPAVPKQGPDGKPVRVGFDPIIGQAQPGVVRTCNKPIPTDSPSGVQPSTLQMPRTFIVPTGGAYFFVPSISALKNELST